MIELTSGDIFEADAEAFVNTVNSVGVMGKGVALQFKQRFPENFEEYKRACSDGTVVPGRMMVHETGRMMNPRYIINFPTKRHWKGKSSIEDIELGLEALVKEVSKLGIRSIAVPPSGVAAAD
jgi:O-acetyl-ADP-ribose deacetylase (regulator of RNase III)